ncbi:hypothetical protein ACSQ67_024148 [Phaseolus vulgaris]
MNMEGDNVEKPLLERKKYFENCPGCKVDKAKELSEGQGVPFTNLFIIWMVVLCASMPISSLFSYLYFMVRDFNIAKTEADISFYAGYVDNVEALEVGNRVVGIDKTIQKKEKLFLNWPLMSSIIIFCVFSLHDGAYHEVFSLWTVSPQRLGGLNFTTNDVGNVLSISGLAVIIYQLTIYPYVRKASGPIGIARISGILTIPLLQSYTFIGYLSGLAMFILISDHYNLSVTSTKPSSGTIPKGAANGISMTGLSLFKAIGPAGGGALLTLSQKRMDASFLPGTQMVFFILNTVVALGTLMTFKPFLVEKRKTQMNQLS